MMMRKKLIEYETEGGEIKKGVVEVGDGMHEAEPIAGQTSFISCGRVTEKPVVTKAKQPGLFD